MHTHNHAHMHTCIHARTHVRMHACTHTHTDAFLKDQWFFYRFHRWELMEPSVREGRIDGAEVRGSGK